MKIWITCLMLLLSVGFAGGMERDITFRKISPPGGLSSESVTKIIQDSYGYVWLGTNYGLLKYDSKQFERYEHRKDDSTSLPNNFIIDLAVDHENRLWLVTGRGLCYFDRSTQSFIPFKYKYPNEDKSIGQIEKIECDKNGNLWICGKDGVGILNMVSRQLFLLKTDDDEISSIVYSDNEGNIWLGTHNGSIYFIDPNTLAIQQIIKGNGFRVSTIYADKNKIWVGTVGYGMSAYSRDGQLIKKYKYKSEEGWEFTNEHIRKIIKDKFGSLWIGAYHGLFIENGGDLRKLGPEEYPGIPHSSIYDIFEDSDNGIWIGTWAGGLSYFHTAGNQFVNYAHTKNPKSLSNNIVSSFAQNEAGKIYVGTEVGGLNKFDKEKGTFSVVPLLGSISQYNIKYQCFDTQGGHWVATHVNGLWYRKHAEKGYKQFPEGDEDGMHVSNNSVYSLFPVDTGLWIGTHGGGVNFYSHKTKKISYYDSLFPNGIKQYNLFVRSIFVDSQSNLWIGTVDGLQRNQLNAKDAGTNKKQITAAQNTFIFTITELSDEKIWIGTRASGVIIYNPANNSFEYFDANGLLKGKSASGIIEDLNGHIWITSNEGLILYNPKDKTSRRFVESDGIQGNWFNSQAVFRDTDNLLYFGGTHGFSNIDPKNIKLNTRPPVVTISKVSINNQLNKYPFFRSSDSQINEMQLSPDERTFKVDFTCDNYLLPEKNNYKYRLINHYDEWITADKEATALFANIPWGAYLFEVMACNNDGVWSENPASFRLTITKPFYASNGAIAIYILTFFYLLFSIVKITKTRTKLRNEILMEKVLRQQQEQLNEMKLKFFTNVSHELRTPLSLISGPINTLSKADNLTPKQTILLDVIQRNSSRLLTLINQVIDLRKIENGKENLHLSTGDLIAFVKERALSFTNEAEQNNIKFNQNYPADPIIMDFDIEKIDNIIFNLLSNAFKFTDGGGEINLTISLNQTESDNNYADQHRSGNLSTDDIVSISVSDTGVGIDSDDLRKVFNRFEQGKIHYKSSSGIGLSLCRESTLLHHGVIIAQSTIGLGSRFIVQLPLKQQGEKIFSELQYQIENISLKKEDMDIQNIHPKIKIEETILVVEDNPDQRVYLEMILSPHFNVKVAQDGKLGLTILENTKIDIIVSDVMMPVMNGYEFCTSVKSNISTSHIPVVLLTALSSTENKIISMQKGADAYLIKPFDDQMLISQVKNLLEQRKKLREVFKPKAFTGPSVELESMDNYFLLKLDKIIEENLTNEEFDIDLLIQLIDLSRSQLHRKLKSLTNYSTTEYIRIYRLEKAIQLMKSENYNLDEISFMVGFNTHSYFTTSFKKQYKKSPKDYMRDMKIEANI